MKKYLNYRDVLNGYFYDPLTGIFKPSQNPHSLKNTSTAINVKELNPKNILLAEEISAEDINVYIEGAIKQISVNGYERDLHARKKCIEYYRSLNEGKVVCYICGFDFGQFYGDMMEDRIHVHHIVPLSKIKKEYIVDPINELIPICPNCHYAIHVLNCTPVSLKGIISSLRET